MRHCRSFLGRSLRFWDSKPAAVGGMMLTTIYHAPELGWTCHGWHASFKVERFLFPTH